MEGISGFSGKHVKLDKETPSTSRRQPFTAFATLVIFDSEATGLKRRPRITELCLLAVLIDELKSTGRPIPRVVNKLQLCFNPESAIAAEASGITGLYNDVLEQMATFTDQASLITGFLCSLPQPVCIIAHNGHCFDFPLLQSEFHKANHSLPAEAGIYCADSLQAFRVLDGLPPIPEWVLQRENEEKQRKALACTASSSAQKRNGNESDSAAVVATTSKNAQDEEDRSLEAESSMVSPNKRQLSRIDNSTDDSVSESKLSKQETAPAFGSQSSVSDADLVEAYDAAIAQADAEDVGECVSPVPELVDSISLQSEQETTPVRDPRWTNSGPSPGHVVKKPPPMSVNAEQGQRVARRLFDEEDSDSSYAKPFQATSDEKIVEAAQQAELEAVTSLPLCSCGAGEPRLLAQASSAVTVTVTNHCMGATGDPLPSSAREKSMHTPGQSPVPAENGLRLPTSSTQNQVSEVTSSSSSNAARQPTGKASPSAPLSSSATPKLSYKLGEIYQRQFGCYPVVSHTAEDDCLSLLKIIMSKRSDFMTFVEDHAVRFDTVGPMY